MICNFLVWSILLSCYRDDFVERRRTRNVIYNREFLLLRKRFKVTILHDTKPFGVYLAKINFSLLKRSNFYWFILESRLNGSSRLTRDTKNFNFGEECLVAKTLRKRESFPRTVHRDRMENLRYDHLQQINHHVRLQLANISL